MILLTREEMIDRLERGEDRYTVAYDKLNRIMDAGVDVAELENMDEDSCPFCHYYDQDCSKCELNPCIPFVSKVWKAHRIRNEDEFQEAVEGLKRYVERREAALDYPFHSIFDAIV